MSREKILIGIIVLLIGTIITGYLWLNNGNQSPSAVAVVNGKEITYEEFINELKRLYGKEVLNEMINRKIIVEAANRYGIKASQDEIQRQYAELKKDYNSEEDFVGYLKEQVGWTKEQLLEYIEYYILWEELATKDVNISEEQIKDYYENNRSQYGIPERFRIQQIVVATEEEANQVVNELNNGSDFNTLAKERSIDMLTLGNGGDLGMVTIDDPSVDPAILNKAKALEINEIATVPIDSGYAIIRVVDHKDAVQYTLEEVKDRIRREIALSQGNSLPEVLEQLKAEMNVQILDDIIKNID
ncbi:hypothetical protein BHF71_05290 [Vulcanibacillus modesticaldus]|uniref:peptidylprolyl isomerase n=1 Tax=Vulcanibacillus modesticaldus TaxID=337097 RepID=A0A1D2YXI2_9BACI|nr:peptidyl-prolyl cis-trans isomerase [Vulcanibacillus modesticaldus]OEG00316.1 hypothetical protein BHF71_05290 [Vulcanibacillus modesticaldus]